MGIAGMDRPEYGNWVSARLLFATGGMRLLLGLCSMFFPALAVFALLCLALFVYFAYARSRFSSRGGNLQARIRSLVLDHLGSQNPGRVLDVGSGSGALAIAIAKAFPGAQVTGVDTWGSGWEYSRMVCERNAQLEGVAGHVVFQKASASSLPFEEGAFDTVVSNLVFHEVSDVKDRKELLHEALRVVRKGGAFVFQDLFLWKRAFGEAEDLLAAMRGWGIERAELIRTCDSEFIPRPLRLPFMVGALVILKGTK